MSYYIVSIGYPNPDYDGGLHCCTRLFRVRLYADDKKSARELGIRAFQREHVDDGNFVSVRVQKLR